MSTLREETEHTLIAWIEENQASLYRTAYSYVKSQDTALDMVQESIYKAIRGVEGLDHPARVKPWFYQILVNTCLDELRRGKRLIVTAPEDLPEEVVDPLAGRAEAIVLRQALERLDEKTKTVIVLRYFEDMKLSEIASILEENLNSVKSRLYRGLRALKIEMEEGEEENVEVGEAVAAQKRVL